MPRELITVQVGQCGNQIGSRFWQLALKEHAAYNAKGIYDDPLSSFFRNVDTRGESMLQLPVGDGKGPIRTLKARAIVVDMEEGVIHDMLKGPLGDVLDTQFLVSDVSGAGNNWAHGHHGYGPQYREQLSDRIRVTVEQCDALQGFMLLHSVGGGTGSGLGTYILSLLQEELPETFRFTASVFPSADDDVVTSPYNALLALNELAQHADCVLPIENQALFDICCKVDNQLKRAPSQPGSAITGEEGGRAKPWDNMNSIAANLLLNMTSSMRFEGSLNVDMNDIAMNLVPFPGLHFLLGSSSPLAAPKDVAKLTAPRTMDQVFNDVFDGQHQIIKADPRHEVYLACGLIMRGAATVSDINRNIVRLKPSLQMPYWNTEGFKIGICSAAPVGVPFSLMSLANNCAIRHTFATMKERFDKLYKRRLFVHHYEEYMEKAGFLEAAETVQNLVSRYQEVGNASPANLVPRRRSRGLTFL